MSKSAPNPSSRILITDTPEQIRKKIKGAVTDNDRSVSFDPVERRGVSNLLSILSACQARHTDGDGSPAHDSQEDIHPDIIATQLTRQGISGHAQLKGIVADAVVEKLAPIRDEYARLREDISYLRQVAALGRDEARNAAAKTMTEVRKKVGLDAI
jgi:tryptophanyl-tRNA synthetase